MLTESVIKKGDAKGSIQNALIGLVIIISAALILGTINPNLLNLNAIEKVKPPEKFSDPVNVGGVQFKRGDIWEGSAVYDTCTSSSVFRDQNCVNQYLNTLNTICREDGGQMTIIRDQNVTTSWWRLALIPLNPTNAFTYSATSFACN